MTTEKVIRQVEAPDGQIVSVEASPDASETELIRLAMQKYQPGAAQVKTEVKPSGAEKLRAEAKIPPETQAQRDVGRIQILKQELREAQEKNDVEGIQAAVRQLQREGVTVPSVVRKPVVVKEPTAADLMRQRLMALERSMPPSMQGTASPEAIEAAQLGASGLAALGGYKASPMLGSIGQRVVEASQRPAFSAPGTPPVTPAAPGPMTSGEKWAANWAGQERPGIGGVPEASAAYQRSKGQGKITSEMSKRFGPVAFPPVEPGVYQGSLVDRMIEQSKTAEAAAREARSPLNRVSQMFGTIGRTGVNLFADLMRSRAMGALGAGSAAYQGLEAMKHLRAGRDEEAALSATGALGGGLMIYPNPYTAVVGGALSAVPYLYRKYRQATPEQTQRMLTNVGPMGEPTQ